MLSKIESHIDNLTKMDISASYFSLLSKDLREETFARLDAKTIRTLKQTDDLAPLINEFCETYDKCARDAERRAQENRDDDQFAFPACIARYHFGCVKYFLSTHKCPKKPNSRHCIRSPNSRSRSPSGELMQFRCNRATQHISDDLFEDETITRFLLECDISLNLNCDGRLMSIAEWCDIEMIFELLRTNRATIIDVIDASMRTCIDTKLLKQISHIMTPRDIGYAVYTAYGSYDIDEFRKMITFAQETLDLMNPNTDSSSDQTPRKHDVISGKKYAGIMVREYYDKTGHLDEINKVIKPPPDIILHTAREIFRQTPNEETNKVCEKIALMVRDILLSDYTIQEVATATFTEYFMALSNVRAIRTMIIIRKGLPEIMEYAATIEVRGDTVLNYINMHDL